MIHSPVSAEPSNPWDDDVTPCPECGHPTLEWKDDKGTVVSRDHVCGETRATPPALDVLAAATTELERFAAIIEGRGEARLVAPHGMTSNGPRRALELIASLANKEEQP